VFWRWKTPRAAAHSLQFQSPPGKN